MRGSKDGHVPLIANAQLRPCNVPLLGTTPGCLAVVVKPGRTAGDVRSMCGCAVSAARCLVAPSPPLVLIAGLCSLPLFSYLECVAGRGIVGMEVRGTVCGILKGTCTVVGASGSRPPTAFDGLQLRQHTGRTRVKHCE